MEKKNKKDQTQTKKEKDNILLSIQNASYQYSDAEEDEYALKDVSYDFEKGKIYAIRGRNSKEKTTLLSLISGLEKKLLIWVMADFVVNVKHVTFQIAHLVIKL